MPYQYSQMDGIMAARRNQMGFSLKPPKWLRSIAKPVISVASSLIPGGAVVKSAAEAAADQLKIGVTKQVASNPVVQENVRAAAAEQVQATFPWALALGLGAVVLLGSRRR